MDHPRYRRVAWHPLSASVPLTHFVLQLVRGEPTLTTRLGVAVCGLWFVLALINLKGNRVLDWLYSKD